MVAMKRKLSEKRLFESLKSANAENDPIVDEGENGNNDDEGVSGPDESDEETSENLELTQNKEHCEFQNSETYFENVEEDGQPQISDSESDSLDLTPSLIEPEVDVESDETSIENIMHN